MIAALETALSQYFIDVEYFQLREIGLPRQFEDSLINKVVTAQNRTRQALVQDLTRSELEVTLVLEKARQTVTTVESKAESTSFLTSEQAEGEGLSKVLLAERQGFKALRDALGLNNAQLLNYLNLRVLKERGESNDNGQYVVGFDGKPTVLNLK
eukprot:TRINITY_DN309_c0_g1_i1.p1 TRINITY_DN309_c0_g1~~TRINITY_DN309_c0_g1_i1.p1  ORF type:complete len:155 (+),score=22.37 TRINITY_DN309_c0_g1_i1:215-679(+)